MHLCPACGLQCDCDGEDLGYDVPPKGCHCDVYGCCPECMANDLEDDDDGIGPEDYE